MNKEFTTVLESNKALLFGLLGFSICLWIVIPIIAPLLFKRATSISMGTASLFILLFYVVIRYIYSKQRRVHFTISDNSLTIREAHGEQTIYFSQISSYNLLMGLLLRLNISGKNHYYCFSQFLTSKQRKVKEAEQKQYIKMITSGLSKKTEIVDVLFYLCFVTYLVMISLIALYFGS